MTREALRAALTWALRNNGGECPADHPAGYAKALRALLQAEEPAPALDVCRLARAIRPHIRSYNIFPEKEPTELRGEYERLHIEAIAREYAALSEPPAAE